MRVELDIFSGRPNPRWLLTAQEIAELRTLIARLRPSSRAVDHREMSLGYRGFIVTATGDEIEDWYELVVFGDLIAARSRSAIARLADDNSEVERLLVASADGHIDDSVLASLRDATSKL